MGRGIHPRTERITERLIMEDDLGPREAEAVSKLLDLAKFAILAMLVATGAMGANALI